MKEFYVRYLASSNLLHELSLLSQWFDIFSFLLKASKLNDLSFFVRFSLIRTLCSALENSEYDQEISQSLTVDKPMVPRGRAKQS